nr:3-oxoadipate enol-lactonase [uncultured Massilia sp.]
MAFVDLAGVRLHYRTDGQAGRPCLVLSNSLGTDLSMWDAQARALAADFFVVRYDTRGHGRSGIAAGPATIEDLGRDVLGLLDHLGIARFAFCGISMGGITGQWLGIHAPERIERLVLANTAARIGTEEGWTGRATLVRDASMTAVADGAAARWFTDGFAAHAPEVVAGLVAGLRAQDPEGYAACCEALAEADLRTAVARIDAPTLVIAGAHDPVTTVADGAWLCERIAGARMQTLAASHLSNIEAADTFTRSLRGFLAG